MDAVDCKGSVVTVDAIGAQKEIVEKIRDKQADYVIALKANQGGLYEQVADFMEKQCAQLPVHKSINKDHGRGEERRVYIAQNIALVDEAEQWRDLHSLAMIERIRHKAKGTSRQVQYYISSLEPEVLQFCRTVDLLSSKI